MPLISICIPTYNRVAGLHRLLQSIIVQQYSNYEVIISDDSTTAEVAHCVQHWQSKLPIQYHKNIIPLGSPANWNKAISLANGDWIKLMHDDDWLAQPDALKQFAYATTTTNASFICSGCTYYHSPYNKMVVAIGKPAEIEKLKQDYTYLFYNNIVGHPSTTLYKKTDIYFDVQFKWVVDVDFYMHYLKQDNTLHYIPQALINTGVGEDAISNQCYKNPNVEIPEYLNMLLKFDAQLLQPSIYVFHCLWTLVKKFKLTHHTELKQYGYHKAYPIHLSAIIKAQKKIPRILLKQTPISTYYMHKLYQKIYNTHA